MTGGLRSLIVSIFSVGAIAFVSTQEADPRPDNRIGAHFDRAANPRAAQVEHFQQAIARNGNYGTYSSPTTTLGEVSVQPDDNPGLPLASPGQQQFERTVDSRTPLSSAAAPSNRSSHNMRNVVYEPTRQDNSFKSQFNPLPNPNKTKDSTGQTSLDDTIALTECSVAFIDDIELPALENGQIKILNVKEGDAVLANQVIGQIDDELVLRMLQQAQLKLDNAQEKADDTTSLVAAENEIGLKRAAYNRIRELADKGSKSVSELEMAQFELKLAMLKKTAAQKAIDAANGESRIEMAIVQEAQIHIRRHAMSVNFNGYVIEIFKHPQEWVAAGEKIMRIARLDQVHVSGTVDTSVVNPHELMNRPVTVVAQLARGATETFQGKIVNIGMERMSGSSINVKAEVENRQIEGQWVLQSESTVTMQVHLK